MVGELKLNGHAAWIVGIVGTLLVAGFAFFYTQNYMRVEHRLELVEDNRTDIAVIKEQIRQINVNTQEIKIMLRAQDVARIARETSKDGS